MQCPRHRRVAYKLLQHRQDDKYTIREAMISSANDRVDREDIRQQSDETYQFWFYYDTTQCAAVHKSISLLLHAIDATPARWRVDSLLDSQVRRQKDVRRASWIIYR